MVLPSPKLPNLLSKGGDYLFPVADDTEAGYFEDIGFRVFIYGDDILCPGEPAKCWLEPEIATAI